MGYGEDPVVGHFMDSSWQQSLGSSDMVAHPVFTSGQEYHTCRIPALLAIPRAQQPDLVLAFAEGRVCGDGDHGEVHVLLRKSEDGGLTWGGLRVVADAARLGIAAGSTVGNPCPIWDEQRQCVVLLLTTNHGSDTGLKIISGVGHGTREVWVMRSLDGALCSSSWETPRNITKTVKADDWSWYATGPGAGIQLKSGRLVAPCDHAEQRRGVSAVVAAALHPAVPFMPIGQGLVLSSVRGLTNSVDGFGYSITPQLSLKALPHLRSLN